MKLALGLRCYRTLGRSQLGRTTSVHGSLACTVLLYFPLFNLQACRSTLYCLQHTQTIKNSLGLLEAVQARAVHGSKAPCWTVTSSCEPCLFLR